jgi:hypothetical protein
VLEFNYSPRRAVCITAIPLHDQDRYSIDEKVERKLLTIIHDLGPNCRIGKFQWLVASNEPCGGIKQELVHGGVDNVLVFGLLIDPDFNLCCLPTTERDAKEFDGIAAFFQNVITQVDPPE